VPHYSCDKCGEDFDPDDLYDVDGEMICTDCLLEMFPRIHV
jgi:formylmethanofuran dehydrogenase subunit E